MNAVRVFIHDCRVALTVGIHAGEMCKAQPVLVNVEIEAALPHLYRDQTEKKLDRVINYESIYNFIQKDLTQMGHFYLLETAAEQVADFCFRDARVTRVRVRMEKTDVFPAAAGAGVEIGRLRPATGTT